MNDDERQQELGMQGTNRTKRVDEFEFEPIRGYPMLRWIGKRPFTSTQYYPAQHKETYGPEVNGWRNKIYWGDNLQVMSHLLKEFRGKVQLIYIDPPFDSKAEYKRKITVRGKSIVNDRSAFEEKQYTDIWTNDEYLQFMYERFILLKELLADNGNICLHCDAERNSYLRVIMDEIFGPNNFINEVIWRRAFAHNDPGRCGNIHDTLYLYAKSEDRIWNKLFHRPSPEYVDQFFDQYDEVRKERYARL